jgi:hypothetical protein
MIRLLVRIATAYPPGEHAGVYALHELLVPLVFLFFLAGCGRDQPTVAPIDVAPPARALPSPAHLYRIDSEGKTTIDNDARLEHFKGTTTEAGGSLTIDARDLAATHGEVKIDLTTLRSRTFENADTNDAQSRHARTWLEAVVNDHVDERMRWAVFRVDGIDDIDPSRDATTIPAVKSGDLVVRSVSLTARGQLTVHGRTSPKTVRLRADMFWANDLDRGPPASIAIRSVEPMPVTLAEHAIVPRDEFGKEAKAAFHLLGTKVGPVASVAIEITAR